MVQPGDSLAWLHRPRDGYGYAMRVPVRFVAWAEWGQAVVDVVKADGATIRKRIATDRLVRESDGARLSTLKREAQTA